MEIANGYINTCPENSAFVYGITPAEAVVAKNLHFKYSNGKPLHGLIVTGEATEIDVHGKPAMIATSTTQTKTTVRMENGSAIASTTEEPTITYTPSTKPRTETEEINRLKRKYTGNVPKQGGGSVTAFVAAFGEGDFIRLPQTFDEVRHIIGDCFTRKNEDFIKAVEQLEEKHADEPLIPAPRRGRPPVNRVEQTV